MTEPLEGAMLPHDAAAEAEAQRADEPTPPTWPDLAYWRETAHRLEAQMEPERRAIADERRSMEVWRKTAADRFMEIIALRGERDALRMELDIARTVIADLSRRPPVPPTDSTRAAMAQPFPARALRTWNTPEIWR